MRTKGRLLIFETTLLAYQINFKTLWLGPEGKMVFEPSDVWRHLAGAL